MANVMNTNQSNARTASGINLLAGLWLILAPFVLGYAAVTNAEYNDVVLGIVVGILAIIGLAMTDETWSRWVNIIAGIWLVIAPFVLGYAGTTMAAVWNDIVLGIIVVALAAWGVSNVPQQQHHRPV